MKNSIRCCISCVLPCGSLDVVCIVLSDGRIEELDRSVLAQEVMRAHPKHVVKKCSLFRTDEGHVMSRVVILPPEAELKKGKIYFLSPVLSPPPRPWEKSAPSRSKSRVTDGSNGSSNGGERHVVPDRYLSETMSDDVRGNRRGRVSVWRPCLESISELST